MTGCFACFKLPDSSSYSELSYPGPALVPDCLEDAFSQQGFLIAPFHMTEDTPLLFIPAEYVRESPLPSANDVSTSDSGFPSCRQLFNVPDSYAVCFERVHSAVASGTFRKLVLSRSRTVEIDFDGDCKSLFLKLCARYPGMMVCLFHTPQSGTWIEATPEPLLLAVHRDGADHDSGTMTDCHTVALAGTMEARCGASEQWSEKNRAEQNVVERFIADSVSPYASELKLCGPYTVKAGHLLHLRTDIDFKADRRDIGKIVAALHPTPAVCGLPRKEAMDFILETEGDSRRYYSGFAGPVGINGATRLYVSLRCAEISDDRKCATLYAGGGIMPESVCEAEFEETELKMRTLGCTVASRT